MLPRASRKKRRPPREAYDARGGLRRRQPSRTFTVPLLFLPMIVVVVVVVVESDFAHSSPATANEH